MEGGKKSEYRYDLLNRQTYVRTLDGREQEDLYDGEGLRAGLKENGKKSVFLFHDGEILSECDGGGYARQEAYPWRGTVPCAVTEGQRLSCVPPG